MTFKKAFDSAVNFINTRKKEAEEKMNVANVVKTLGGVAMGAGAILLILASKVTYDYAVPYDYDDHNIPDDIIEITDAEVSSDEE